MSVLPQIERQLREAAERRAQSRLTRMLARTHRLRGVFLARPLMIALAVLLSVAGVALAARALIGIGSPAPREYPSLGQEILRQGTRLLSLRVPDPAGGPAWGMRLIFTTGTPRPSGTQGRSRSAGIARWGCVQFGRVVNGRLGVLGRDGAFHNDGLFHELPVQPEACGAVNQHGELIGLTGVSNIEAASAYQGLKGCVTEPTRRQDAIALPSIQRQLAVAKAVGNAQAIRGALQDLASYRRIHPQIEAEPTCPASDLRQINYGVAGPQAQTVTVTGHGIHMAIALNPQDDGAYMIVQQVSPRERLRAALRSEDFVLGVLALHETVRYENGRSCPQESTPSCLAPPGSLRALPGRAHTSQPAPSASKPHPPKPRAADETPLSRQAERDPSTPNPVTVTPKSGGPHTAFKLSFRSLLNGGGYSYLIKTNAQDHCQREAERATGGDAVTIGSVPIVRGQTISKTLTPPPHGLCPGSYRIYVAFSNPAADSLENFPFATVHFTVIG